MEPPSHGGRVLSCYCIRLILFSNILSNLFKTLFILFGISSSEYRIEDLQFMLLGYGFKILQNYMYYNGIYFQIYFQTFLKLCLYFLE